MELMVRAGRKKNTFSVRWNPMDGNAQFDLEVMLLKIRAGQKKQVTSVLLSFNSQNASEWDSKTQSATVEVFKCISKHLYCTIEYDEY